MAKNNDSLISCIKAYGPFHGFNEYTYRRALKHCSTPEKEAEILTVFLKNQEEISNFYNKFLRYF